MLSATFALIASVASADALFNLDDFDPGTAQIVVLGEVHDNPAHHENQAMVTATLGPKALVFEMVGEAGEAAAIDQDLAAMSPAEAAKLLSWADGWPNFGLYHPILKAAPDAVLYGSELPREQVVGAMRNGAAHAFGIDAARFGLDHPLPEDEQTLREEEQHLSHCEALPAEMLPGMVEAQRLRDAQIASVALKALRETGGPVAIITGNGHARTDWGVPPMLKHAAPEASVVSLGQLESPPETPPPFDHWIVTEGVADRGDPCAVFN